MCESIVALSPLQSIADSNEQSNLLVSGDHQIIIGDYDFVWVRGDLGMSNLTPYHTSQWSWTHIAPEYWDGNLDDNHPSLDVYSFAILTWVLHTGCVPFPQLDWGKFRKHVFEKRERPKCPESMNGKVWSAVIKWWAHEPNERPPFEEIVDFLSTLTGPGELLFCLLWFLLYDYKIDAQLISDYARHRASIKFNSPSSPRQERSHAKPLLPGSPVTLTESSSGPSTSSISPTFSGKINRPFSA